MLWLRSVFFTLLLPGRVLLWVLLWISTQTSGTFELGPARWIGLPVLIIGAGGLLWCIWDFGRLYRKKVLGILLDGLYLD